MALEGSLNALTFSDVFCMQSWKPFPGEGNGVRIFNRNGTRMNNDVLSWCIECIPEILPLLEWAVAAKWPPSGLSNFVKVFQYVRTVQYNQYIASFWHSIYSYSMMWKFQESTESTLLAKLGATLNLSEFGMWQYVTICGIWLWYLMIKSGWNFQILHGCFVSFMPVLAGHLQSPD